MRPLRPDNPRAATSLVEILLVIMILSIALLALISVIQSGTRQVRFNEDHALASLFAAQVLERYREESRDFLTGNFSTAREDLIEQDEILTPKGQLEAQELVRTLSAYKRSLVAKPGPDDTLVLRARVERRDGRMQPLERELVLAPNPALGARP